MVARSRRVCQGGASLALVVAALATTSQAHGYSYESPVTDGCHEAIVVWALRQARSQLPSAGPLPSSGDDEALLADLPFTLPDDLADVGAAALLLGARDPDVKGRSGIDTDELAAVHGDPATQQEHCLRLPEHDEPAGAEQAWAACRAYVSGRMREAVRAGLGADGWPDPAARAQLDVSLAFRGAVRVGLPTFHLRMGQGLHALADSFSHALRTSDARRVTTPLNWVDYLDDEYDEARDGPPHMAALDACEELDELRRGKLAAAKEATLATLAAALAPSVDEQERLALVEQALDDYLGFEPGCTFDNRWCDAPENALRDAQGCGCSTPGQGAAAPRAGALALLAAGLVGRRQRRRATRPKSPRHRWGSAALCAAALVGLPPVARAQAPLPAGGSENQAADEGWLDSFGVHAAVSGALDHGALAFGLGARFAAAPRVLVGLDGEFNPWVSWETTRVALGAFNGYGTVIIRHPVAEDLALRTTGRFGVSVLLFDLVGVPAGSTGPFVGVSFLGLDYELGSGVRLVFDPADVALPVPRITAAPFTYLQYRLTLGLQLGA